MLGRISTFAAVLSACVLATSPGRLDACTGTACSATGPIAVAVDSMCAPMSPSSVATVVVPLRVVNTSMRCASETLDVTLSVSVVGGNAPLTVTLPIGAGDAAIPSNPFRLWPHVAETASIVLEFPAGTEGTTTLHVRVDAPGVSPIVRPFSVSLFGSFYATASEGNVATAPGEEHELSWTIFNPGSRTRTIQYAVRVLQTSSAVNPLNDRFPTADCGSTRPPGDPADLSPKSPDYLVISEVTIPGHSSAPLCMRTASYSDCVEGSNCLYRLTLSETLTGDTGDSNQNLTVVEPGFVLDGSGRIDPAAVPALGPIGLGLLALVVAVGGGRLARRA